MKIEYVSYGLGNNFGDTIELNRHLLDYPDIHDSILKHELSHTDKFFSLQDLKLDLSESEIDNWKILKFMFRHPLSFTQFLPIYWTRKRGFVYDLNLIIIYLIFLTIFYIGFSI